MPRRSRRGDPRPNCQPNLFLTKHASIFGIVESEIIFHLCEYTVCTHTGLVFVRSVKHDADLTDKTLASTRLVLNLKDSNWRNDA